MQKDFWFLWKNVAFLAINLTFSWQKILFLISLCQIDSANSSKIKQNWSLTLSRDSILRLSIFYYEEKTFPVTPISQKMSHIEDFKVDSKKVPYIFNFKQLIAKWNMNSSIKRIIWKKYKMHSLKLLTDSFLFIRF